MTAQLDLFPSDAAPIQPLPLQIAMQYGFSLQYHSQADDTLLYAVQDWIAGIAQTQDMQRAKNIFQMVKRRASSVMETLVKMPYRASNGRMYQMDFASDVTLYQITQRMDTETGVRNEVLTFLAKAGAFVDDLRQDPENIETKAAALRHRKAVQSGKDEAWQAAREMGVMTRKQFTSALMAVNPDVNIGRVTNDVYKGVLGSDADGLRRKLHIGAKANPRDAMSRLGLLYVLAAEEAARIRLAGYADDDVLPLEVIHSVVTAIARAVGLQGQDMARILGIDLTTGMQLLKGGQS